MGKSAPQARLDAEDDAELLRRASARDEAAARVLFRRHVQKIHRHVARVLGPTDGDVEDVVQQTFLAAIDGADSFHGRSSVSTWLLGIATRRALDHARARYRRGRWSRITELVGLGTASPRPDHRYASLDEASAALEILNLDQRTVFLLHEVEGHTLAEIKAITGVNVSTLHARLAAARAKLDAIQGDDGGPDGAA